MTDNDKTKAGNHQRGQSTHHPNQTSVSKKTHDQPSKGKAESPTLKRSKWFDVLILMNIIFLVVIVVSFGYYYQQIRQQSMITDQIQAITQRQQQLTQQLKNWQISDQQTIQQQQKQMALLMQHQKSQQDHRILSQSTDTWQTAFILQAWYVTSLADIHLTFDHDIQTAIILLQTAQKNLRQVPEFNKTPLQQRLKQAILNLQTIPTTDAQMIIQKLQAMIQHIQSLQPLLSKPKQAHQQTKETTSHQYWQIIVENLGKLITVYHHSHPQLLSFIMTKQQQRLWQQYMINLCQQAEWALKQHQPMIYQHRLTELQQTLSDYHPIDERADNSHYQQLQLTITQLKRIHIKPLTPDLTLVIQEILDFYKQIANQTIPSTTQNKGK